MNEGIVIGESNCQSLMDCNHNMEDSGSKKCILESRSKRV